MSQKTSKILLIQYRKLQVMFKVFPASLQKLTRRTVFSKTVFSIARSTFRMYSVMAIFKTSIFLCCNHQVHREFLITPYKNCWQATPHEIWRYEAVCISDVLGHNLPDQNAWCYTADDHNTKFNTVQTSKLTFQ